MMLGLDVNTTPLRAGPWLVREQWGNRCSCSLRAAWALTLKRAALASTRARRDRLNDAGNTSVGRASPLCLVSGWRIWVAYGRRLPLPGKVSQEKKLSKKVGCQVPVQKFFLRFHGAGHAAASEEGSSLPGRAGGCCCSRCQENPQLAASKFNSTRQLSAVVRNGEQAPINSVLSSPLQDQHSSDASAAVLSGASTPDRHAVADGVHVERPAPAAQATGNLRSRVAAAGQNMHGGSADPAAASGAASAQRAHNGVDGGRLAVTQMCIKAFSYTAARV